MSRRGLLGRALAAGAAGALAGLTGEGLATWLAFAATAAYAGDVLVVLSLRGGFDGLSAVVPARRSGVLQGAPHDRRPEGPTAGRRPDVRAAPGAGAAAAAVAGRPAGRRARRRPAQPHPVAFRRDGGDGAGRRGHRIRTGWLDRMLGVTGGSNPFHGRVRRRLDGATGDGRAGARPGPAVGRLVRPGRRGCQAADGGHAARALQRRPEALAAPAPAAGDALRTAGRCGPRRTPRRTGRAIRPRRWAARCGMSRV